MWIPILTVAIGAFIIYLAGRVHRCIFPDPKGQPPEWVFKVIWPILFGLLAWAGIRIWNTTESIGRRISFFIIMGMLVLWPFLAWHWCQYGLATLSIMIALMFTIILIIMMTVKDKLTCILLIPLGIWLAYASVLSYRVAKENE